MATSNNNNDNLGLRSWAVFAYHAYAKIVVRKHNLSIPEIDLNSLSLEELDRRTRLMAELAHLPAE